MEEANPAASDLSHMQPKVFRNILCVRLMLPLRPGGISKKPGTKFSKFAVPGVFFFAYPVGFFACRGVFFLRAGFFF